MAVGYLGLTLREFGQMTMREFFWKLEAKATEKEDNWDYIRHIIAGYVGKVPERIMRLPRDRIVITDRMKDEAAKFLTEMRKLNGN